MLPEFHGIFPELMPKFVVDWLVFGGGLWGVLVGILASGGGGGGIARLVGVGLASCVLSLMFFSV